MSRSYRTVETSPGSKDNVVEIPETPLVSADGNIEAVAKGKGPKRESSKTVNEKNVKGLQVLAWIWHKLKRFVEKDTLEDMGFLAQSQPINPEAEIPGTSRGGTTGPTQQQATGLNGSTTMPRLIQKSQVQVGAVPLDLPNSRPLASTDPPPCPG